MRKTKQATTMPVKKLIRVCRGRRECSVGEAACVAGGLQATHRQPCGRLSHTHALRCQRAQESALASGACPAKPTWMSRLSSMASQSRSREPRMTKKASQKLCRCAKTLPLEKESQKSSLPSSTPASAGQQAPQGRLEARTSAALVASWPSACVPPQPRWPPQSRARRATRRTCPQAQQGFGLPQQRVAPLPHRRHPLARRVYGWLVCRHGGARLGLEPPEPDLVLRLRHLSLHQLSLRRRQLPHHTLSLQHQESSRTKLAHLPGQPGELTCRGMTMRASLGTAKSGSWWHAAAAWSLACLTLALKAASASCETGAGLAMKARKRPSSHNMSVSVSFGYLQSRVQHGGVHWGGQQWRGGTGAAAPTVSRRRTAPPDRQAERCG